MATKFALRLAAGVLLTSIMAASGTRADEPFNVRFSWKLKGEYAALFLAQQDGMFARQGLTVRLGEGAGVDAALGSMIQGNEDVVIAPAIYVLSAISKGMPAKLIAMIQPVAPAAIVSHPDKPINTPADLEGKTLAAAATGDTAMDYLKVLCSKNNIDCGKIKIVKVNIQARLPQLMSKQVDGMGTYWNIDLPQLEYTAKQKFPVLDVSQYGERVPGLSVVASDAAIQRNPDKLKRFLVALNEGFVATNGDVAAATKALENAWAGAPPQTVVENQVRLSNQTFPVVADKPRGFIEGTVVASALDLLKGSGQISEAKPVNAYFTNSLLSN
jgi:NitT/TauT family transport system substrate-binding protein